MKLGLHIYDFTWPGGASQLGPTLVKIAQTADAWGFDRISVGDHVWQSHYLGGPEREVLSCYPTLAFLTAHTSRIKPIAMATAAPCWQPVLLAKTVTTLDVLSGGRALLGIGAGDYEEEALGLGLPFPPLNERYERLEEMLQICLRMWHGEQGDERPFEGKHYRIKRPLNLPQSLSRPHPPILLAGSGEYKTLRLVARYADACNLQPGPQIPKKLEVLRQHCEAEGRITTRLRRPVCLPSTSGTTTMSARMLRPSLGASQAVRCRATASGPRSRSLYFAGGSKPGCLPSALQAHPTLTFRFPARNNAT